MRSDVPKNPQLEFASERLYELELSLRGIDVCKFDAVKQYHNAERAAELKSPLGSVAFSALIVEMHAKRPLEVAIENEFKIQSGLERLPHAVCAPEREK